MPRGRFLDVPDGDSITYDVVTSDGYRLATFQPSEDDVQTVFDSVPFKKCRDDDILINAYPKAGTMWLFEMIQMVLLRRPTVTNLYKGNGMLEMTPESVQDAMTSPRVLNTHLNFKYLPKGASEKKIKCVLLCRNPKDVVVSFYNHTRGLTLYQYDGQFQNYLDMFMRGEVDYGCYATYLLEWQEAIRNHPDWPIHMVYYEDLKKNGFEEMVKLCRYLEQYVDDSLLRQIVDNCEINKLRQGKHEIRSEERIAAEEQFYINGFNMFRKGEVGGWKRWFTVAQNEAFDQWWTDKTRNIDMFHFKYTT